MNNNEKSNTTLTFGPERLNDSKDQKETRNVERHICPPLLAFDSHCWKDALMGTCHKRVYGVTAKEGQTIMTNIQVEEEG